MDARTQEYRRLRREVTACVNAHDLLGVLDDAPPDEYDPEIEDFTRLFAKGEPVTPELVAAVCQKWFGDSKERQNHPRHESRHSPTSSEPSSANMLPAARYAVDRLRLSELDSASHLGEASSTGVTGMRNSPH